MMETFPAPDRPRFDRICTGDTRGMAPDGNHRIVRPDGPDWTVLTPGARRASYRSAQCSEAVARAQRIVRNGGGGVVDVLDDSGSVVRTLTVGSRTRGAADLRVR
jgi:hypothetical protein